MAIPDGNVGWRVFWLAIPDGIDGWRVFWLGMGYGKGYTDHVGATENGARADWEAG